jgi:membrane protease YdiL (CAAX protease family)
MEMSTMAVHPNPPRPTSQPTGRTHPATTRRRRIIESVAFVAVWVAAGYLLPLGVNGYLLLGIPLTIGFQVVVRRRPVRELFAGGTSRFALDKRSAAAAVVLASVPAYHAVQAWGSGDWSLLAWYSTAVAGAGCAAFALRAGSVPTALRAATLPIAIGAGGMAIVYGTVHLVTGAPLPAIAAVAAVATYTALYFPATFLIEEVAFRGALDAHVHHDGEGRGWQSAVLVSALWGLWHLPVATSLPFPVQAVELVVVHVALGVPLSFAWRRTRNLAAPALAHAVIDAVRNAFMLGL